MSSAVPLPRSPSTLLLGSAAGLFAAPGCPACRYTVESSDTYLTWFALEGHADADVLRQVCASRGMCARHTRRLFAQPGAAARLTAVYRYVVAAAADDPAAQAAACPACDQEATAEDRVLSALVDELATGSRAEYKLHGGLCLPHLRRAVRRGRGLDVRWLIRFVITRLDVAEPDPDFLAGGPDLDADDRAILRAALPAGLPEGVCPACWRAAAAERDQFAWLAAAVRGRDGTPQVDMLCARHVRDAASDRGLLAWQAQGEARRLSAVLDGKPRLLGIAPGWLSPRARRALADPDCPVCHGCKVAAADELSRLAAAVREQQGVPADSGCVPCVRHAALLCAADSVAGRLATGVLIDRCREIAIDLEGDFALRGRTGRLPELPRDVSASPDRPGGRGASAWRRAAALIDGSVLGGCPPDRR